MGESVKTPFCIDGVSFSLYLLNDEDCKSTIFEELVMTYRDYKKISPYIQYLLLSEDKQIEFMNDPDSFLDIPCGTLFLKRILEKKSSSEFKALVKKNYEMLCFFNEYEIIKSRNKSRLEGAIRSILSKSKLALSLTINLCLMEAKRSNLNLANLTDDEIRFLFKGLFCDFRNSDGTIAFRVLYENMRAIKEVIAQINSQKENQ